MASKLYTILLILIFQTAVSIHSLSATIFQHEISRMSFDLQQNTTAVVIEKTCHTNISISKEDGLFKNIKFSEDLTKTTKRKGIEKIHVLAASSGPKQQIGILREIVHHLNDVLTPKYSQIEMVDSKCDICKESRLVKNLMKLIGSSFPKGMDLSVIVDDDKFGEITLKTIVEYSIVHKRNVATVGFVNKIDLRKHLAKIANLSSHIVILDCNGSVSADILNMAKIMGIAGGGSHFTWLLTERTMVSLPLSWPLPSQDVFGMKLSCNKTPQNMSYFLSTVKQCKTISFTMEKNITSIDEIRCGKSKLYTLQEKIQKANGKSWEETSLDGIKIARVHYKESLLFPRLRVVFADPYPPWLLGVDFAQTDSNDSWCGRNGKYGYRYGNKTSNEKIPVCAYGLNIDILRYLEQRLGFVGEVHISRDGRYGNINETTGEPDGILGDLYRNESDFAIDLTVDPVRRRFVEFTVPYHNFPYTVIYTKKDQYRDSGVLGPFSSTVWWTILGTIAGLVLFIWVIERFGPYGRKERKRRTIESYNSFGFLDSMNYMWGLFFCGEIITEKPASTSSRATIVVMSFVSILILALYSANLIAFLVVADETPLVTGLNDPKLIGKDSRLKLCTLKSSATERFLKSNADKNIRELYKKMTIVDTYWTSMRKLKERQVDLVILDDIAASYEVGIDKTCSIQSLPVTSQVGGNGFSYRKDFTWKQKFKEAALKMTESGITDDLLKKWLPTRACINTSDFKQLGRKQLYVLFLWITIGASICILLAILICSYNYLRNVLRMARAEQDAERSQ